MGEDSTSSSQELTANALAKAETIAEAVTARYVEPPHHEPAPQTIGRYRIERELGRVPGVKQATVVENDEVAAYLVPTEYADLRAGQIRRLMKDVLPEPWVPRSINFVIHGGAVIVYVVV